MAWQADYKGKRINCMVDDKDHTWVPVRWLAAVLNLAVKVDAKSGIVYLSPITPPSPSYTLPSTPVGASVQPWIAVTAPIRSYPGSRSPELLADVIAQFRVGVNYRYQPNHQGRNETYCNIFVSDVTKALSAEIPHWVDPFGKPVTAGGRELDANDAIRWLRDHGPTYGWYQTDETEAMVKADLGHPVVAAWENPGGIGHMAMVRPGQPDPIKGIPLAQAGAINFDDGYLKDGFGERQPILFFVHD